MKGSQEWTWCSRIKGKKDGLCLCVGVCVQRAFSWLYATSVWEEPIWSSRCDLSNIFASPVYLSFFFYSSCPSVHLDIINSLRTALSSGYEVRRSGNGLSRHSPWPPFNAATSHSCPFSSLKCDAFIVHSIFFYYSFTEDISVITLAVRVLLLFWLNESWSIVVSVFLSQSYFINFRCLGLALAPWFLDSSFLKIRVVC